MFKVLSSLETLPLEKRFCLYTVGRSAKINKVDTSYFCAAQK